jgi:AAA+ superfamily predicted ATPase
MSEPALDVVEFLLTAHLYREHEGGLDENDLPPRFSAAFWSDADPDDAEDGVTGEYDGGFAVDVEVPGVNGKISEEIIRHATGVERPWEAWTSSEYQTRYSDAVSGPDAGGRRQTTVTRLGVGDPDEALRLLVDKADRGRLATNPVVAHAVERSPDPALDLTRAEARANVPDFRNRRVYIDALLDRYFDSDDEDDVEMLDLVQVRVPDEIEFTLDDLVLTDDQKGEIEKIRTAMEKREFLGEIGLGEIGKLLFVGPPGTGKTTVSRALAHELGLPFVEVKLSMITSQYLGETAKNVERTFEVARRLSPCILFIDEFDSVAKTRRSDEHAALKRAVNTLLKSIDSISLIRDDVLLIGATNHPDQLDAAAWRRFDEIVNFPKPDRQMRADILRVITRRMEIAEFDPDEVAAKTTGLTGSDLRMVMREAVLEALTEGRETFTQTDVMDAVADFEERDNLKNMDMIDGDADAMVAGDGGHDHDHDHDD